MCLDWVHPLLGLLRTRLVVLCWSGHVALIKMSSAFLTFPFSSKQLENPVKGIESLFNNSDKLFAELEEPFSVQLKSSDLSEFDLDPFIGRSFDEVKKEFAKVRKFGKTILLHFRKMPISIIYRTNSVRLLEKLICPISGKNTSKRLNFLNLTPICFKPDR